METYFFQIFPCQEFVRTSDLGTVPAVPKDETLTRILSFWAQKLGSDLTPNGTIWLQINSWRRGFRSKFRCASFCIFKKNGFRVSGTKRKNRWRITSVKKSKKWFWWFSWLFIDVRRKNSLHIDAYNFSASPPPPQAIQTCYDNRKIGFSTWEVKKPMRLFVPPGQ